MRCRYCQNPRIQFNCISEKHLQHPTKLQAASYQQKLIDFETSAILLCCNKMSQCKCYAAGEPEIKEQCLLAGMLLYLDSWHFSADQFSFEKKLGFNLSQHVTNLKHCTKLISNFCQGFFSYLKLLQQHLHWNKLNKNKANNYCYIYSMLSVCTQAIWTEVTFFKTNKTI